MKNYKKVLIILALFISTQTFAQQLIPFQARLTNGTGTVVADGVYAVNFNIYDTATAGTALWTETHSTVSVVGGVVNVILGSITPLSDPDNDGIFSDAVTFYNTNGNHYIGITIGAGQEMLPRHQLIPSFHSRTSDNAANLAGNSPSYYSSVSDHQSDIQQTNNSIQQLTSTHNADVQSLNSQIAAVNALTVPTGAIMAFDLTSCPTGWSVYNSLAGRVIVGSGQGRAVGQTGGEEQHTLNINEMPSHHHSSKHGDGVGAKTYIFPSVDGDPNFRYETDTSIGDTGGSAPHNNMQPFKVLLYCRKG